MMCFPIALEDAIVLASAIVGVTVAICVAWKFTRR